MNTRMPCAIVVLALAGCVVVRHPAPARPPQPVQFEQAPNLVLIPGQGVYYAPAAAVDLYLYQGVWYHVVTGVWYRSRHYNGPWVVIQAPPAVFYQLPPECRRTWTPPGLEKHGGVPPGQQKPLPPGLEKKQDEAPGPRPPAWHPMPPQRPMQIPPGMGRGPLRPGPIRKRWGDDEVPPGRRPSVEPDEEVSKDAPPGLQKKEEAGPPPGRGDTPPPGQQKKDEAFEQPPAPPVQSPPGKPEVKPVPPGQEKKAETPAPVEPKVAAPDSAGKQSPPSQRPNPPAGPPPGAGPKKDK